MAAGMTFLKRGSENPRARAHVMYSCTAGHARKRFTETNLKLLQSILGQLTLIWGHHFWVDLNHVFLHILVLPIVRTPWEVKLYVIN